MNIKPLHVYVTGGERYALLRGPARLLLTELSIVGTWSPAQRGYVVRAEHVGTILAVAESRPDEWSVRVHRTAVGA